MHIGQENSPLKGKTAIITGASRGIGSAIARRLAYLGANITIHYRTNKSLAYDIALECQKSYGVESLITQADLANPTEIHSIVEQTRLYLGAPTILINNAGLSLQKTLLDTSYEEWQELMNVHAGSTFLLSKQVLPYMIREGFGRIISIASVFGMVGGSCEVAYSASKGALIAFTKALAKEVGRTGVTVNAVAPGPIETDMMKNYSPEELNELAEESPVGRLGTPQDVAECAAFLALPSSSYLTGQILSPNGGWFM